MSIYIHVYVHMNFIYIHTHNTMSDLKINIFNSLYINISLILHKLFK